MTLLAKKPSSPPPAPASPDQAPPLDEVPSFLGRWGTQAAQRRLRHPFFPYFLALFFVITAVAITQTLSLVLGDLSPFMFFHLSVIAAAWLGGLASGITASCLSSLVVMVFWIPPLGSIQIQERFRIVDVATFFVVSVLVSLIVERLHIALRQAKVKADEFQKIFELSAIGVFQRSLRTGAILRANRQFSAITGYGEAEYQGRTLEDLLNLPASSQPGGFSFSSAKSDWIIERKVQRKDGGSVWIRLNGTVLPSANSNPPMTVEMIEDITDQKTHALDLENRVELRTAELRETNEALQRFCYSLAHDLRSPVRAILVFAEMIERETESSLDKTGREYFNRIIASAHRMDKLIVDLLDYGRISHQSVPLDRVSLQAQVDEITSLLENEIRSSGGRIHILGTFPDVCANALVLRQALLNLVSNALKFARKGVPPEITIRAEEEPNCVRLFVEDNGIGIKTDQQERIFDLFQRLNPENDFQGTGVGLSIVKKGVERMKGTVSVRSEFGKGSSFWITLPKA